MFLVPKDEPSKLTPSLFVSLVVLIITILHFLFHISSRKNEVTVFYDHCNIFTYTVQYVIRFTYSGKSMTFDDNRTTIFCEIEHSIRQIIKIPLTPTTMGMNLMYKGRRCAKIFIRTKDRYRDVRTATLYHNGRGAIVAWEIELQDIGQTNAIIAHIEAAVFGKERLASANSYPFGREVFTKLEDDILPSVNVTMNELIYFVLMVVNVMNLCTTMMLNFECLHSTNISTCAWEDALQLALYTAAIGFGSLAATILPFRYLVKRFYRSTLGRGMSEYFHFLFLFIVTMAGMAAALYAYNLDISTEQQHAAMDSMPYHELWWITWCTANACILVLVGVSFPLAICIGFIQVEQLNPTNMSFEKDRHDNSFEAHGMGRKKTAEMYQTHSPPDGAEKKIVTKSGVSSSGGHKPIAKWIDDNAKASLYPIEEDMSPPLSPSRMARPRQSQRPERYSPPRYSVFRTTTRAPRRYRTPGPYDEEMHRTGAGRPRR